jgi:hypothetical protein
MSWIDLADQSMVGRTGSVRRRMLLRGGVGAAGRIALPVGKMVGRTGLGQPKNAPAGEVGAAGRIALPLRGLPAFDEAGCEIFGVVLNPRV